MLPVSQGHSISHEIVATFERCPLVSGKAMYIHHVHGRTIVATKIFGHMMEVAFVEGGAAIKKWDNCTAITCM